MHQGGNFGVALQSLQGIVCEWTVAPILFNFLVPLHLPCNPNLSEQTSSYLKETSVASVPLQDAVGIAASVLGNGPVTDKSVSLRSPQKQFCPEKSRASPAQEVGHSDFLATAWAVFLGIG